MCNHAQCDASATIRNIHVKCPETNLVSARLEHAPMEFYSAAVVQRIRPSRVNFHAYLSVLGIFRRPNNSPGKLFIGARLAAVLLEFYPVATTEQESLGNFPTAEQQSRKTVHRCRLAAVLLEFYPVATTEQMGALCLKFHRPLSVLRIIRRPSASGKTNRQTFRGACAGRARTKLFPAHFT